MRGIRYRRGRVFVIPVRFGGAVLLYHIGKPDVEKIFRRLLFRANNQPGRKRIGDFLQFARYLFGAFTVPRCGLALAVHTSDSLAPYPQPVFPLKDRPLAIRALFRLLLAWHVLFPFSCHVGGTVPPLR